MRLTNEQNSPYITSVYVPNRVMTNRMLISSKTQPTEEVIKDEENRFLVDFFSTDEVSARVITALEAGKDSFSETRQNARRTIVEKYDLRSICLPVQLKLLKMAMDL